MDNKDNNKWQVRGAVLAIFLLGFVAGLLALNAYNNWSDNSPRQTSNQERIEQTFERLQLTESQQTEVRSIFNDARNEVMDMRKADALRRKDVRSRTDERLQKILTPEQWQKFQQYRAENAEARRRRRERSSESK